MIFTYEFKNSCAGDADGKITLDVGLADDAEVKLFWAAKCEGKYYVLDGYTPLLSVTAGVLCRGVTINKSLTMPEGATALLARYGGGEIAFDLPEEKLANKREEPRYTVAFAADFHLGGWGSERQAKEGLVKARDEMNTLADFVVTAGDLVQWHGAYSEYEFKKYNWNGEKFGDNGEQSEEYIGQGVSQWEIARTYLDGFTIPVYHCQGNHDICDADNWSPLSARTDHFGAFLDDWIAESEETGKYEDRIERDKSVHYYDARIKGDKFIFTEAPRPSLPHNRFGQDQLYWLDKTLFDGEMTGKPIFVMGHCPLDDSLNDAKRCLPFEDIDAFFEILKKHPTAIYVSGHSHYTLDTLQKNAINGAQITPSFVHSGGMTTTVKMGDGKKITLGSTHGVICEVYSDRAILRGRDYSSGEWVSLGHVGLDFKAPCLSGEISIKKLCEDDGVITLAAVAENSDGISFEWYVDGKLSACGVKLCVRDGECNYVALRAKDSFDGFCSVIYEINR